jgi:outer membrane protein assembly factor BamB
MGLAVALDAASGKMLWSVDILQRFGGENLYFGISESPLIDGNRVIFTPGGKDASVVALDKKTGETLWTSKGLSETSAYCSPRILTVGKHRQIVTFVAKHLVGLDPESGAVLWRHEVPASYDIHANSPLFDGDLIFVSHAYDKGSNAYRLAADGKSLSPAWEEQKLDIPHGGAVLVDGLVYGAAAKKSWHVLNAQNGEILASIKRLGKGTVVYADGLLYGYTEQGEVLLVDPDPKHFAVISRFKIAQGEGQFWSHPVIADGVLYIRHGDVLMAYDISAPEIVESV